MADNRQFLLPLVLVAALVVISVTLLIVALAMWLAELIGSVTLTCLILGTVTAVAAVIIYRTRVQNVVQQFNERMNTVYEVANTFLTLYRLGVKWLGDFLK